MIGVRETRRIVGEYTLTADDLATGRALRRCDRALRLPVDIHSPTGAGGGYRRRLENGERLPDSVPVLVPRDLDGLLVAGRSVSATHEAMGATRVMPPAFAMGQAAGTAAALAIEWGREPRAFPCLSFRNCLFARAFISAKRRQPRAERSSRRPGSRTGVGALPWRS